MNFRLTAILFGAVLVGVIALLVATYTGDGDPGTDVLLTELVAVKDKPEQIDKKSRGMIDVRWKFDADGSVKCWLEFRTGPDEPATATREFTVPPAEPVRVGIAKPGVMEQAKATLDAMVLRILAKTVGSVGERPILPPVVDDF